MPTEVSAAVQRPVELLGQASKQADDLSHHYFVKPLLEAF